MTVYERIKNRRNELGLSVDHVADALGVSRTTVYRYESAEIEKVPTSIIEKLAKVLHTSPSYLMGWTDQAESTPTKEDEKPKQRDFSNEELMLLSMYRLLNEKHRKNVIDLIQDTLMVEIRGEEK